MSRDRGATFQPGGVKKTSQKRCPPWLGDEEKKAKNLGTKATPSPVAAIPRSLMRYGE